MSPLPNRVSLCLLLATALAALSGCTSVVNKFAFYPDRTYTIPPNQLPESVRHEFIATADGEKIELFIVAAQQPRTALLYFHGNGGNIAQRLPELQKLSTITGATVVGIGYRGYGASTGHANELGLYQDGETALRYTQTTLGFSADRIFLLGRSLGSTVATSVGAQHKIGGIILVTPLLSGRELAKAHGMSAISFVAGGSFNNLVRATALTSRVLVVHGTDDEVIPYRHGQALFEAITSPKRFVTIEHGKHNDLEYVNPDTYWNEIAGFLKQPAD